MKYRMIWAVLFFMLISIFSGCSRSSPDTEPLPPEQEETGPERTLAGKGETITVNVIDNTLFVTNLSTVSHPENKLAETSELLLPGKVFKRDPTKKASTADCRWEYVSVDRYQGKMVNGVPTDGLVYHFREAAYRLALRVTFAVHPTLSGPFEVSMEIDNLDRTETRIMLEDGFTSFSTRVKEPETTSIIRIKSEGFIAEGCFWSADVHNRTIRYPGSGIYVQKLTRNGLRVTSDRPHFQENGSYYLAQFIDRNSEDGVFLALSWTTGKVRSVYDKDLGSVATRFYLDNSSGFFSTLIQPGETFAVPSVYVMPYDGDMEEASNRFKSWYFACKVVPALRDSDALPYVQIDNQLTPEEAKNANIDSLKWDYGWWNHVGFADGIPYSYESTWTLLADCLDTPVTTHDDVLRYGTLLDELGLNFTLYVLLHENFDEAGTPTDQYGELNAVTHPDWFSNQKHPACRLADLGNTECVEYLKTTLEKFFKNNRVDQWRTDFEPIAAYSNQKNRHDANGSDVSYWCTVGFVEILDHLYRTVDGFKFESCSSGGGNKDLLTAEWATFFNCDDTSNYLSLRTSFYDSSYLIHPAQLELPCNVDSFNPDVPEHFFPVIPEPETADGDSFDYRDTLLDMGFRSTIISCPHWASWKGVMLPDYYKEYATIYKEKVKHLVRDGSLYHILPRPDGKNWDGIMYADPDSGNEVKGVVFLFKPSAEAPDACRVVLRGLNADQTYRLMFEDRPEQNRTAAGGELMTDGVEVTIPYFGSEIIWISDAE